MSEPHTSLNKLARIDQGQANERILRKQPRTDLTRVEGASIKYTTDLHSPDGKRFFARYFYTVERAMYFIDNIGRSAARQARRDDPQRIRLEPGDIETIEVDVERTIDEAQEALIATFAWAEQQLKRKNIATLASYDGEPLTEEVAVVSAFGERYFDLVHEFDRLMPVLDTLVIKRALSPGERANRRTQCKKRIAAVAVKARAYANGLRKRIWTNDEGVAAQQHAAARESAQGLAEEEAALPATVAASDDGDGVGDGDGGVDRDTQASAGAEAEAREGGPEPERQPAEASIA